MSERDLSNAAYGSAEERKKVAEKHGMKVIHNTHEAAAYKHEKHKKIYVAHRGTAHKRDLSADAAILFGLEKYHPRFKRAKRLQHKLEKENPGYKFVTTGHSLGGALAQHAGKSKRVKKVVTFNKGSGLVEPFRVRARKQTDYTNVFDPVSLTSQFQRGGKIKRQIKVKKHPHTIHSSSGRQSRK